MRVGPACVVLLASLVAATLGAQTEAFVPIAALSSPEPLRSVSLGGDRRLELQGQALFVTDGGGSKPVPCTRSGGAGAVLAMAPHADGSVFVACEHGVFVLDAEHVVLDEIDRRDGVPTGRIVSLHADGRGRLWLCSAEAFGGLDVRFAFGRTFTRADGLPPGPFLRVAGGPNGRIELQTAAGVFAYQPDQGPPPRVVGPGLVQQRLEASPDGVAAFTLDVEGLGTATLRQRQKHHHLLPPIVGRELTGLRPGQHTIEVHAVDRDLRRTVVAEYTVKVPLPAAFDTRVLPFVALLVGCGVFLLAWFGGDTRGGWRRLGRAIARTTLAMVVGLQLLAGCLGYGRSWPFLGFSMYTENWHENDVLYRPRIVALTTDGQRVPLHESDVGVVQDGYWQMLAEIVHGDDGRRRRFLTQLDRCREPGTKPFAGFLLGDGRIRLTANGPVDVAPIVFVHYRAP